MIKSLQIKNYALIRELEMSPSSHLNIITGETGAGKSIMLGAVGLLLGKRADTKVLLDENQKCIVEGTFDISAYSLQQIFEAEDLDYESECVIRREISPSGKSRAFVNDTPTNLSALKAIGEKLMDVHSQHESLQLGKNIYQLNALDVFAAHPELVDSYRQAYKKYASAKKQLEKLESLAAQSAEDADYKQFLLNELMEANLDDLDQEALEKELEVLENAEDIKLKLSQAIHMLDESEVAILQQLNESKSLLHSMASFSKDLEGLSDRLESTSIELADISNEMQRVQDKVEHDPEKIQQLSKTLLDIESVSECFICGPEAMIFMISDELQKLGLPKENIHFELFFTGASEKKKSPTPKKAIKRENEIAVTILDGGKEFHFNMDERFDNVLDAAIDAGMDLPFACKGGVCSTCKCKVLSGDVEMKVNYALEQHEVDQNFVLSCQSVPKTKELTLDFDV